MAVKKTVLEYVQAALSVMDSDTVDSIDDTVESAQIALLFKDVYFEFINREEWSWLNKPVVLDGTVTNPLNPTRVKIPDSVKRVTYLSYDVSSSILNPEYRELHYLDPIDFVKRFNQGGDDRQLVLVDSFKFYVHTNRQPEYWTSFDDELIHLDAFDSAVDSTIISNKLAVYGTVIPEFTVEDAFIPDLPVAQIPMLQHSLNAAAMLHFKQIVSPVDERREQRQLSQMRRQESKTQQRGYYSAKYGRK